MAILRNTTVNDTGFLQLPVGTTGQRPSVSNGRLRFNSTTGKVEFYNVTLGNWLGTPATGVVATGGTVYDVDVEGTTYRVHVFTTTGNSTFTVTKGGSVEYLVVAGGGGGGGDLGGGGGAGGLITDTTTVTTQVYPVTVGDGGRGAIAGSARNTENTRGGDGENSSILDLTAIGGGGGGVYGASSSSLKNGRNGGSGGGAGSSEGGNAGTGGLGTSGQGNNGGLGLPNPYASGGGGGAGSTGQNAPNGQQGGNGGDGVTSLITGSSASYAGGGGGSDYRVVAGATPGNGGLGGGGNGGGAIGATVTIVAQNGTANTGGGGGGGAWQGVPTSGGAGGSGIVIIRYPLRQENPITAAGKVIGDGLVLDLDFAKPTVYSGFGAVVNDSRLNGITGTINGSLSFSDPRTHRANLISNGSAGNNILLRNESIPTGNLITLEFWNFGITTQQSSIISGTSINTSTTQTLNIHLPWSNGHIYWDVGDPFNRIDRFATNAEYQGWHHWAFTKNALTGIMSIYLDGSLWHSGSGLTSPIPAMTVVRLFSYHSVIYGHNGRVAHSKIYNRALTATEISQNYNATRWRFGL